MKRLLAAVLLVALAACDDDKAGAPDELTIIVQADRKEVKQWLYARCLVICVNVMCNPAIPAEEALKKCWCNLINVSST